MGVFNYHITSKVLNRIKALTVVMPTWLHNPPMVFCHRCFTRIYNTVWTSRSLHSTMSTSNGSPGGFSPKPTARKQRLLEDTMDAESERAAKASRENQQLIIYLFVASVLIVAWLLGSLQFSFVWVFFLMALTFMVWWGKVFSLTERYIKEKEILVHRRRALRQSETSEWLNFVINRWLV